MASRAELLSVHEELTAQIRAAEEWTDGYKKNEETFAALVSLEAQLQTSVAEYLHGAASRAARFVDWSVLKASGAPNADDEAWEEERRLFTIAVLQIITELTTLGVIAAEVNEEMPIAFDTLQDAIMEAARKQVAQLVKGATDTTRKLIRESVAQSIALGEDANQAVERLMKVVDNPIRAEMIAQTEPVNAYQRGYYLYAKKTGAVSKEWDGLAGACKICAPLIGKTIPLEDLFKLSNGQEVLHPAGHPRCRCSLIYNYE